MLNKNTKQKEENKTTTVILISENSMFLNIVATEMCVIQSRHAVV